jgi:hypothetical protein
MILTIPERKKSFSSFTYQAFNYKSCICLDRFTSIEQELQKKLSRENFTWQSVL